MIDFFVATALASVIGLIVNGIVYFQGGETLSGSAFTGLLLYASLTFGIIDANAQWYGPAVVEFVIATGSAAWLIYGYTIQYLDGYTPDTIDEIIDEKFTKEELKKEKVGIERDLIP